MAKRRRGQKTSELLLITSGIETSISLHSPEQYKQSAVQGVSISEVYGMQEMDPKTMFIKMTLMTQIMELVSKDALSLLPWKTLRMNKDLRKALIEITTSLNTALLLGEEFANKTADKSPPIIVTHSHAVDPHILKEALDDSSISPQKVAVIVPDRHKDIAPITGIPDDGKASAVTNIAKIGFGDVSIIGVPKNYSNYSKRKLEERIQQYTRAQNDQRDLGEIIQAYLKLKERTAKILTEQTGGERIQKALASTIMHWMNDPDFIALMGRYLNLHHMQELNIEVFPFTKGQFDSKAIAITLCEKYKQRGITNIIFSIDLDVLHTWKERLSAIDYSAFATLAYINSLELSELQKTYKALLQLPRSRQTYSIHKIMQPLLEGYPIPQFQQRSFRDRHAAAYADDTVVTPTIESFDGMRTTELIQFIRTLKKTAEAYGITVGICRSNGRPFIGTITEANFKLPDLGGNTARTIKQIASVLIE